ncbi:hypothetical protein Tsubulata_048313 [Turnera subulata]|uniref:Uncharacterized protein n=1 Tax=Turnera subulata TaxID=218843 RepID=A0A9Q0G2Q6_9ROSI|nr:hypothetical protein Tsubulata_048313 [Turnera subulata]
MYDEYQAQFSRSKVLVLWNSSRACLLWLQQHLIHPHDVEDKFYKARVERISRSVCGYVNNKQKARGLLDTSEDVNGKIKTYNTRVYVRDYYSHLHIRMEYIDPAPSQPSNCSLQM